MKKWMKITGFMSLTILSALTARAVDSDTYALDVYTGLGSGTYTNMQIVPITANAPATGKIFYKWIGDIQYIANVTSSSTAVTMPARAITLSATYVDMRFIDNTDGTVTDTTTGLMWMKNANLGAMSWDSAVAFCEDLVANGYDDWRLPTVAFNGGDAELDTLYGAEGFGGTPFVGVQIGDYYPDYWAGPSDGSNWASAIGMSDGRRWTTQKSKNYYVWPVRGYNLRRTLTVNLGSGSGSYLSGTQVEIAANVQAGLVFTRWIGAADYVESVTSPTTTVTMPLENISLVAEYAVDKKKPKVKVRSPKSKTKILAANGLFVVSGTAKDKLGMADVRVKLNDGAWVSAITTDGWKTWSLPVTLVPGVNAIRVYGQDLAANISFTKPAMCTYEPGVVMTVQINGEGSVKRSYDGQVLEVGKKYKMKAKSKSKKVSVFSNWTYGVGGALASDKSKITFTMQSNLVLTANFQSLSAKETLSAEEALPAEETLSASAYELVSATADPGLAGASDITVDGYAEDWENIPRTSFSYLIDGDLSVTQEVASVLSGSNIALLLTDCPFGASDTMLVYFKLFFSTGDAFDRHTVDLWTSGSELYAMVDGQAISGLQAVLSDGVLEVQFPVADGQTITHVILEKVGCGLGLGGSSLTELFEITPGE